MAKIRINRAREYRENLRLYIVLTKPLTARLKKFFAKQSRTAGNQYEINGVISRQYYEKYYKELYSIMEKNARSVIEAVSIKQRNSRLLKKATDETNLAVYDYTTQQTAQNVGYITETTKAQIQSAITFGISEGLAVTGVADLISKSTAFSENRAKMIARTETHQAMNYGAYRVARTLSLKKPVKEWGSALDERTRHWHSAMNGQRILVEDDFLVFTPTKGGGIEERYMKYPGDVLGGGANVINCRCFAMYYDEDDVVVE